jgi:hypothetical protein
MPGKKYFKLFFVSMFVLGLIAVLLSGNTASRRVFAFPGLPPDGFSGAPGEQTCAACHNTFALNSGSGQVQIVAPSTYEPGMTYHIAVQSSSQDPSRKIWGFELTVLTRNDSPAGELQATGSLTEVVSNGSPFPGRQYMEHTQAGNFAGRTGGVTWTFDWVAPSTDAGPVTFYGAFNQGNDDGTDFGDQIYTTSQTVQSQSQPPLPPPVILSANIAGKNLFVMGQNFDGNSVLLVDGVRQRTLFDPGNPAILTGKKTGKHIGLGDTVTLQVENTATGASSNGLTFTRN